MIVQKDSMLVALAMALIVTIFILTCGSLVAIYSVMADALTKL